ncbi:hypothetical protein ACFQ60_13675 [Streptomyces zhihengii]
MNRIDGQATVAQASRACGVWATSLPNGAKNAVSSARAVAGSCATRARTGADR